MNILNLNNISIAFGGAPLLDNVKIHINAGERVCLVGRNGEGKSTLLKLIAGEIKPDSGNILLQKHLRVAQLHQEVSESCVGSVHQVIKKFLPKDSPEHLAKRAISNLQLDLNSEFSELSGGLKRRTLLAATLATMPDLLLLDEPTNHLDIKTILHIEKVLLRWKGTLIFVSHDRAFVRKLSTRILELDRGTLYSHPGNYDTFLSSREKRTADENTQNALFDSKLSDEEQWIRKGIKARRTRNEGRVRRLHKMRQDRKKRRELAEGARLLIHDAERSGDLVLESKNLHFEYNPSNVILKDFSLIISRGDRIGLVGTNGSGKTSLLRVLLGDLLPQRGTLRHGTNLQIAHFDQLRQQLDLSKTVIENILPQGEFLDIGEQRRHIYGYLNDFLFTPERARTPVSALSGGERSRLLLACLFVRPANLLVLDEPTNDLDAETLELLEEQLIEYTGTLLIVSHDRSFLDNVITSLLVLDSEGQVDEYIGGYSDWLEKGKTLTKEKPLNQKESVKVKPQLKPSRKLSYNEQRELDSLPDQIEQAEAEQLQLQQEMSDPDFFKKNGNVISKATDRLSQIENTLSTAYKRWQELSEIDKY
ncbi:MAG: ATP-binding cassette domain-containing protein [Candidatus Latescibacterota bacterium]|nr:ATP-binding cassette domain-containing protein [Candidatus Latescibacterota bacterium]